jgi:nicotinate-nucleotide pyrophosphorylase (carboxylating)
VTRTAPVVRRLTEELLAGVDGRHRAVLSCTEAGVVAGLGEMGELMSSGQFGSVELLCADGQSVGAHSPLAELTGSAIELAAAGDMVLGPLGFAGGIATHCRTVIEQCPDGLRIVCGGWKKLPVALKPLLRAGLAAGGVAPRLVDGDFVYVDKNAVILRGGVTEAVTAARGLDNGPVAVQIATPEEAIEAVVAGAAILMDDTGDLDSLRATHQVLQDNSFRNDVTLAFAGGVATDDLERVRCSGADVVDLGRAILDAPLWDVHLVVVE